MFSILARRARLRQESVSSESHRIIFGSFHSNPVTRGLCQRAVDWKWSSARYYLDLPDGKDPQLPRMSGPTKGTVLLRG